MKIEVKDGRAYVYTPYNPTFVKRLKNGVGGAKWNGSAWVVPEASVDAVRSIMRDVYGETDLPEGNKVAVKVEVIDDIRVTCDSIVIFGKVIARAWGRDSGAKAGDDVVFVGGSPKSGGSVKNWRTIIPEGSVFEIHNVPENMVKEGEQNYGECGYDGKFSAKIIDHKIDRDALEQEKAKLIARIAEIDALLKGE